jgi:hypothetical protein
MIHSLRCCAALGRVRRINRDEKRKFRNNAERRNGRQSETLKTRKESQTKKAS